MTLLMRPRAGCLLCSGCMDGDVDAMMALLEMCHDWHVSRSTPEYRHVLNGYDGRGRTILQITLAPRPAIVSWAEHGSNPWRRLVRLSLQEPLDFALVSALYGV
ncbi:hypothetical protein K458DRAFT_68034 [Lentithecium fluviatile CBS 122367]|uniref:Uncharacterized protein n=1 Tax=Lentithecium fluviatile CBS 122367 TaxID=1168545 RepID=A0A6G1JLQ6_9PLEO|nr:hypothetical protein K458DRAFT_68034 [Lentithecium fluviatile CBS 122367]